MNPASGIIPDGDVSKDGTTYQTAERAGMGGNFLIRAVATVGQ
ncbi:MAG: hypothetical protein Q8N47_01515 [Bryobacterales bacterium]|nr:hypothetical protein [Bryobacterales bacterium]